MDVAGSTPGLLVVDGTTDFAREVVEVRAVFTGFGAIVSRMSIITTDFEREVRTHGVNGSMDWLFSPPPPFS